MTPLSSTDIRGTWATLLLPIRADESIDFDLLRSEIRTFAAAKVDGVYSNGSAGEFYAQTEDEFDRLHKLLADECERAHLPFQIGASHPSPQISLGRLQRAKALKPGAFQIILPDWFPPALAEIHRFIDCMARAAYPIPLVLYNPPHAKRRLDPSEWGQVIDEHPAIAGIKVAGGDQGWYEAMKGVLERISVFIPGHHLATGLSRGAHGAYSNMACLNPASAQRWYRLCCSDPRSGLETEVRINRFITETVLPVIKAKQLSNMAADKALGAAGGWLPGLSTRLRWPYTSATAEDAAHFRAAARALIPEFFVPGT